MSTRADVSRRIFLASAASLTMAAVARAARAQPEFAALSPEQLAENEAFWNRIAAGFVVETNPTNLIAGVNNPAAQAVLDEQIALLRHINLSPLSRGRFGATKQWERVRTRLAALVRTRADEIALVRSTTEGANIVISGHPFARGDEILTTRHDYHALKNALRMRAKRDGLTIREVTWRAPVESHKQIVDLIGAAITERTKLIMVCHVLDGYGQILPIRDICRLAQARGIRVLVDGAQAFGHIDVDLTQLGCDYYATSLHKWTGAPLGTGFLYIRQPLIPSIRTLFGVEDPEAADIRKFEGVGTKSVAEMLAVHAALDLLDSIGAQGKYARLRRLKRYWVSQVAGDPRFTFLAKPDSPHTGALQSVEIAGRDSRAVWTHLFRRGLNLGIHPYVENPDLRSGIFVAPHLFTRLADLDRLVAALRDVANNGVPI
jgi:selenocysteine lyase/cysteine desulfurase